VSDIWQPIGPVTPGVAPFDGMQVALLINDGDEPRTHGFWQEGIEADGRDGYWNFAGWCWTHDHYCQGTTSADAEQDCDCVDGLFPIAWASLPPLTDADIAMVEAAIVRDQP
jgi:hypothetical protein